MVIVMSTPQTNGLQFVLTLSCPDKPGIVYAVSSFLVQHSANIIASQQYSEPDGGLFFMRDHFGSRCRATAELERDFTAAEAFHDLGCTVSRSGSRPCSWCRSSGTA
jgi:formyltetrahydrofolate deformylase